MERRSHESAYPAAFAAGLVMLACAWTSALLAQGGAPAAPEPVFDVVSIKRNTGDMRAGSSIRPRPDGGITMINMPAATIVSRAYSLLAPGPAVGLPGWASSERYDVVATSTLTTATPAQQQAMLRAMLADRFQLKGHLEQRSEDAYEAVLARADGRLGPGLTKIDTDCDAVAAERLAAAARGERPPVAGREGPLPPCLVRSVGADPRDTSAAGDVFEGEGTMASIVGMFQLSTGRAPVQDKTGLTGSYRVRMVYDMFALRRRPEDPPPFDAPNVFDAATQQLGLKLQRTKIERAVLVVERMERPTEN